MKLRNFLFLMMVVLLSAQTASAVEPDFLPPGMCELHGTVQLRGQATAEKFWLRLLPADKEFGGNRVLQIVYTPPLPATLGGTHLADVPFVLLDNQARVVAWNDRAGMSQMTPGKAGSATYVISRDRTPTNHTSIVTEERIIPGERGWDRTIAPLLLALAWRTEQKTSFSCVDLFADEPISTVAWDGSAVNFLGQSLRVEADAAGRVQRVTDAQGIPLVTVTAWLHEGDAHALP